MNRADAVTKVCSVIPSCASNGSMMDGKNHRITLVGREHFNPRLPTRPLFSEDKFAALKILPSLAQEECDLKRKHDFAVEILVETVEIADAIFQKQGGWALLACPMKAESFSGYRGMLLPSRPAHSFAIGARRG